jgi:hypothetical protein
MFSWHRWIVSFATWPLYPRGKNLWYQLDRRLGGPRGRSGRRGEDKILDPTGTRTPTSSVIQLVASILALWRYILRYSKDICRFHLQGLVQIWKWKRHGHLKRQLAFNALRFVVSQKMELLVTPFLLLYHSLVQIGCEYCVYVENASLIIKVEKVLRDFGMQFFLYLNVIIWPTDHTPKITQHSTRTHSVCPIYTRCFLLGCWPSDIKHCSSTFLFGLSNVPPPPVLLHTLTTSNCGGNRERIG